MEDYLKHVSPKLVDGVKSVVDRAATLRGQTKVIAWYRSLADSLEEVGIPTLVTNFPDPLYAREVIWVPFVVDILGADENTVIVGHSSGAVCCLRLLEKHKVKGAVVVSAYTTHMDDPVEKKSGYFDRPWLWNDMKQNAEWIIQFHSRSDHLVPISEGRLVAKELGTIYHETENDGHFQDPVYPSFLKAIQEKLNK